MKQPQGHGFLEEARLPEDFIFGADNSLAGKFSGEPLQPNSDWRDYLPANERQAPVYETNACTSHGTLNAFEILIRRVFGNSPNYSDRKSAKGSGTDPARGNSPKKVADYLYRYFTVYESEWPATVPTLEQYYAEIPDNINTLALARGAEFQLGYEYVNTGKANLREALKYSPLGISVPAWAEENGKYYRPQGWQDNHWVCCVGINDANELIILDSYSPFLKTLRADLTPSTAMKYHIQKKIVNQGAFARFIRIIRNLLGV